MEWSCRASFNLGTYHFMSCCIANKTQTLPLDKQGQDCFSVCSAALLSRTAEHDLERTLFLGGSNSSVFFAGGERGHSHPLLQHYGSSQQPQHEPEPRSRSWAVLNRQEPADLLEIHGFSLAEVLEKGSTCALPHTDGIENTLDSSLHPAAF